MDVDPAELGAAVRLGEHLARVEAPARADDALMSPSDASRHERVREALLAFEPVRVGGAGAAQMAVEHDVALRRLGHTVGKAIDCLIAAWCIEHEVPLLHADRDFLPFVRHRGLMQA